MALNKYFNSSAKKTVQRICELKPTEPANKLIQLNSGRNVIGRSKETGIRDVRCSKQQLALEVDVNNAKIQLTVLGINPCSVNGMITLQGTKCELEHGDLLEIVYGRHAFEVVFKPPPESYKQVEESNHKNDNTNGEETVESWASLENGGMVIFTSAGLQPSEKIAAYDLDGTIIKTKSGNVFPKNIEDWEIIYPEVPTKLKRLHQDGYKICFFTNQAGIAKGKVKLDEFKQKVRLIVKKLGVPIQAFIAIADGYYRKPLPGMWECLDKERNGNVKLNLGKCFYVGDAAGRPEENTGAGKRKKDHSLSDRLFASNIGISFYTPEEHFLGKKSKEWTRPDFEPSSIHDNLPLLEPQTTKIPADNCELIIMVGLPGSGKSHFCHKHLMPLKYEVASADKLGSTHACVKMCERTLSAGDSCVVDNTNVDQESRRKFIEVAKRLKVPCRSFVMNVTPAQVRHNIAFRQLTDTSHSKINEMVYNTMKKKYKTPALEEGFSELVRVNLRPDFGSTEDERMYKLYLVDK